MNSIKAGFYLWRHLPNNKMVRVGVFALEQFENGKIDNLQFKYDTDYLSHHYAIALDPINAPLTPELFQFETSGRYLPGFIDDCLPDDWGKKVLACILSKRHIDIITLLKNNHTANIGSIIIVFANFKEKPINKPSFPLEKLIQINWHSKLDFVENSDDFIRLLKIGGSGVGGARPKLLAHDKNSEWLIKFNRSNDQFDVVAAEYASMKVAKKSQLETPDVELGSTINRKFIKIKRFDISPEGGRYHLLSINSLLKAKYTQEDPYHSSYEDIAKIICKYCINPEKNIKQLFGQILLNGLLNNTDDHLRNFSLIHKGKGWELSPIYDLLPSMEKNTYHQLSLLNKPFIALDNTSEIGKMLGINHKESKEIIIKTIKAFLAYPKYLKETGIEKVEQQKILQYIKLKEGKEILKKLRTRLS